MFIYTVKPGDSLANIASRFGLTASRVATDNQLMHPNNLEVGQSLVIMSNSMRFPIREGQTLYSLSQEFQVPLDSLIAANPNVNPISLQIGDIINIPAESSAPKRPIIVNGYAYPTITDYALNCALPSLTFLSPFSYSITPTGEIITPNDEAMIEKAKAAGVMPLMTVTNIYNGTFSTEALSSILSDDDSRERLISAILSELNSKGYYGLNLDMEYIDPADREAYNSFLREIADILHSNNFILVTAVAPKYRADQQGILYESHDYRVHGEVADYIVIMTYEWGYTYGYSSTHEYDSIFSLNIAHGFSAKFAEKPCAISYEDRF